MKALTFVQLVLVFVVLTLPKANAQVKTVSDDVNWKSQQEILKGTNEADLIIRIGDVDNLGFGWPEEFDPFCGMMTISHEFPWEPDNKDFPGFDRILLSSKFVNSAEHNCGGDGYSGSFDPVASKPVTWNIPVEMVKDYKIGNIYLQIFVDDFQAPTFCSKFQILLDGKRFAEGEKLLNAIDQTGPVGKLISIPVPEEFYPAFQSSKTIGLRIDESTGAADGFAIDFIRVLINRKLENTCKGDIAGVVIDKETDAPISGAKVWLANNQNVLTDSQGRFTIASVPTGYEIVFASAPGYADGMKAADVVQGEQSPEIIIYLEKGKEAAVFGNQKMIVGETVSLKNILFDQGKAEIRNESFSELDKVVAFLKAQPNAEIELSGHTSSEGEAVYNRSLSYQRVKSCKDYILTKGIDPGRIITIGFGPDRPIVPNDTEANRVLNRRVEMRLIKL